MIFLAPSTISCLYSELGTFNSELSLYRTAHEFRDFVELVGDEDTSLAHPGDFSCRTALRSLHNRASMTETDTLHPVSEPSGDEGNDRQFRLILLDIGC